MKKKISSFIVVVVMLLLVSQTAYAAEDNKEYSSGHFFYHSHEGYVSISGYLGRETEITIPSNISGKPVSEIEAKAFDGCDTIQTITVPDTVVIVHDDSFTGAASLKKIISHTVGVTIQADSGVEITYIAEENKEKDKTVTDNKDKDSSENKNSTDKTDTDKNKDSSNKTDTDNKTQKNNQTDSDQKTDTETKAETDDKTKTDSGQNTGSTSNNDSKATSSKADDTESATQNPLTTGSNADPDIGDYAYEENGTGLEDGDGSKSNTNQQITVQTEEKPKGIQIPRTDNAVITTDDEGNLVKIDSTGNQTKIDDAHTYTLTEAKDGTVKITDESGEEVVVDEAGTLTLPSGKMVTLADDAVISEAEKESGHRFGFIVAAGALVVLAVAVIVLYIRKKKV